MRLSKIEIAGFRGVRDPMELDFSAGFTVISGRNGSGKSTICDAVEYVLTGDIHGDKEHTEDSEDYRAYIPWKRGKESLPHGTYVTLTLTDDVGRSLVVGREWDEGPFIESDQRIESPDRQTNGTADGDAVQRLIEALCVSSEAPENPLDRLCKTSILRDEIITEYSVDAGERDRFKFVRSGLGTEVFPETQQRAVELKKELESRRSDWQDKVSKKEDEVRRLQDEIEKLREEAENIEDLDSALEIVQSFLVNAGRFEASEVEEVKRSEIIDAARRLSVQMRDEADELSDALREWNALDERINRFRDGGAEDDQLQELKDEKDDLQDKIENAEEALAAAQERLSTYQEEQPDTAKLAELHSLGKEIGRRDEACPLCGEPHSKDVYEDRLRELRTVVNDIVDQIDDLKDEVDQQTKALQELKDREEEIDGEIDDLQSEKDRTKRDVLSCVRQILGVTEGDEKIINSSLVDLLRTEEEGEDVDEDFVLDENVVAVEMLKQAIEERREDRTRLREATSDLEASLAYERLAPKQEALEKATDKLEEYTQTLSKVEKLVERSDEVRLSIEEKEGDVSKKRIEELGPLINELYSRFRPHVDWENIGPKVRGTTQLYLSFKVGDRAIDEFTETDIEELESDGKLPNPSLFFSSGQRRAVGLAFLLAVHLGSTWSRLETLILDDPVQHIDDFRALQITEVLSAIRRNGRQIIVTVEDEALARLLCRRLRSSTEEQGKHIQMEYDAYSGTHIEKVRPVRPMPRSVLEPVG